MIDRRRFLGIAAVVGASLAGIRAVESARRLWLKDALVEAGMSRARERGWNDTYTYTKSLGERMLVRERGPVLLQPGDDGILSLVR